MHVQIGVKNELQWSNAVGLIKAIAISATLAAWAISWGSIAIVQAETADAADAKAVDRKDALAEQMKQRRHQAQAAKADRADKARAIRKATLALSNSKNGTTTGNAPPGNLFSGSGYGMTGFGAPGFGMTGAGTAGLGMTGFGMSGQTMNSPMNSTDAGSGLTNGTGSTSTTNQGRSCAKGIANSASSAKSGAQAAVAPTFNPKILKYAIDNLGNQVGDGECWTLAEEALIHAGAKPANEYVFGTEIPLGSALPGDILQFESARFVGPGFWMQLGTPHHTGILYAGSGTQMVILNQHVNGHRVVQPTVVDLANLQSGTIRVYRAVAKD